MSEFSERYGNPTLHQIILWREERANFRLFKSLECVVVWIFVLEGFLRQTSILALINSLIFKVWVGGVPCDVQSVADSGNEMTCTTGAKPSPYESVFTGGQGIKFEVFPNQNDVDFLDYTGEKCKY